MAKYLTCRKIKNKKLVKSIIDLTNKLIEEYRKQSGFKAGLNSYKYT